MNATEYCEKYGIIPYKVTETELIYYANYPSYLTEKRTTYKVVVNLITEEEQRIKLNRWNKFGNNNLRK